MGQIFLTCRFCNFVVHKNDLLSLINPIKSYFNAVYKVKGRTFEQRADTWQQGQKFILRDGAVVVDSVHLRLCIIACPCAPEARARSVCATSLRLVLNLRKRAQYAQACTLGYLGENTGEGGNFVYGASHCEWIVHWNPTSKLNVGKWLNFQYCYFDTFYVINQIVFSNSQNGEC